MDGRQHGRTDQPLVGQRKEIVMVVDQIKLMRAFHEVADVQAFVDFGILAWIFLIRCGTNGCQVAGGERITRGKQRDIDSAGNHAFGNP